VAETTPRDWFLVQHKPNSVRIAERNLLRQGITVFLPMEKASVRRGTRFVEIDRPLFAGYLFVGVDREAAPWRAISSTVGVTRVVSFGRDPAQVPSLLIEGLRARCDESGHLAAPRLSAGQVVEVMSGPFADFIATVDRIAPDRRVWVLMDVMGGRTSVSLSEDQVKPA